MLAHLMCVFFQYIALLLSRLVASGMAEINFYNRCTFSMTVAIIFCAALYYSLGHCQSKASAPKERIHRK